MGSLLGARQRHATPWGFWITAQPMGCYQYQRQLLQAERLCAESGSVHHGESGVEHG